MVVSELDFDHERRRQRKDKEKGHMILNGDKYDAIVIGAGPAGSTVSYILSENSLRVLLIDKCLFPRDKLCGGLLTEKSIRLLETIFKESQQTLKRNGVIDLESNSYTLWYRSHQIMSGLAENPFRFVRRSIFDFFLLSKARSCGANVLEGETVRECDPLAGTVRTKSGQTYQGRFIVGADGVGSVVRRSLPQCCYDLHKWQRHLATGIEVSVPLKEYPREVDHLMIYFGFVNFGYAWTFPRRDRVVVGMGGINRENPQGMRACFRSFLTALGLSKHLLENCKVCPIPFGYCVERPGYGSTLLVGDAAGFADAIFGEGLYYALKSGELAAEAILSSSQTDLSATEIYACALKKCILPHLCRLKKRGRQLYLLLHFLGYFGAWLYVKWKGQKMITQIHFLRDA